MTISVRVDPITDSALYILGDELILDVRWVDKTGAFESIDDTAAFVATIFRASGESIASVSHELVGGTVEPTARFVFPLAIADDLAGLKGVYVALARVLSPGPPPRLSTFFSFNLPIRALAGAIAPTSGLSPSVSAPTLIEISPAAVTVSPRGPAGSSAAQQLAATRNEATGLPYIAEPTTVAMADWLEAFAEGVAGPASAYALSQGDYAKAKGDYAKAQGDRVDEAIAAIGDIPDSDALQQFDPANISLPVFDDPSANIFLTAADTGFGNQRGRVALSSLVPNLDGTQLDVQLTDADGPVYNVKAQHRFPYKHYCYNTGPLILECKDIDLVDTWCFSLKHSGVGPVYLAFGSDGIVSVAGGVTSPGQMLELTPGSNIWVKRNSVPTWQVESFTDPSDGAMRFIVTGVPNYTIARAELGASFLVNTAANPVSLLLPSSTGLPEGTSARFLMQGGANPVTINRFGGGGIQAQIFNPGDEVTMFIQGGLWTLGFRKLSAVAYEYRAAGSYSVPLPVGYSRYRVRMMGAGSGGGSGRRGAAGTARFGGNGGSPGSYIEASGRTADLPAAVTLVVGAGGAGGASAAVDDTDGGQGANGGTTTFGLSSGGYYASAFGGAAGFGGRTASNPNFVTTQGARPSGAGATSIAGAAQQAARVWGPGGPAGAGITAANAPAIGLGGYGKGFLVGTVGVDQAATAGSVVATNPKAGSSGGSSITAAAEAGTNGADGGPGGGGGASANGFASGAGGRGSDGWIVVEFYN